MASFEEIVLIAKDYISWDPNEYTREIIREYLKNNNVDNLKSLLSKRLDFGTAGLRGAMGAGYNRMNDLVVLQTCQGLVRYFEKCDPSAFEKGVVIGYDHRSLGTIISSEGLAKMSAAVFLSQGFKVFFLNELVPTPFVAFAVTHLKTAAGIMVTASHNPKQDNGYKVYWNNGSQIITPHDNGIAECIASNLKPWQPYLVDDEHIFQHPLCTISTPMIANAYYESMARLCIYPAMNPLGGVKAVYSAMHGVGCQWVRRSFQVFYHVELVAVPSQCDHDATFPTVSFPNPEEKGVLQESINYAASLNQELKASHSSELFTLIIANDPDADRLAIAELQGSESDAAWHTFSGNELGVLLGHWQIMNWKSQRGQYAIVTESTPAVIASVVSSRMLKCVAKVEGVQYFDTLTGFKWIGDCALKLRSQGVTVLFSYEEALGYCIGDVICDKDGVSAAAVLLEMAIYLKREFSRNVLQHLQYLYSTYGVFVSYNSYVICHDPVKTELIFQRLRTSKTNSTDGGNYWEDCCGVKILAVKDITRGYDSSVIDKVSALPKTPETQMIMYEFENGVSVTLRTSGTEPKIKFYTEIAGIPGQEKSELEIKLRTFIDALIEEMLQPTLHNLIKP